MRRLVDVGSGTGMLLGHKWIASGGLHTYWAIRESL